MKNNLREQFFRTLEELAKTDRNVIIIVNDVGYSFFDSFKEKYPDQFINAGIIEQTITGIAAGLAIMGKKPYVYSMIPFVLMRNYEQLRNDVCYQNLDVKFIGVSGSAAYKFLGSSHNLMGDENEEDLLKNLPNIKRYYPKTNEEADKVMRETYQDKSPAYIRL